jgi:translation initiation factor 2A
VLFDQRVRTLHDFGTAFTNTVLFNPQGRLLLLAGFGNLAGKTDIYDRRTLNRIATIDASNTSFCEWSPDGRFLLTATLSPRLRVDNGIKIWHCSGPLLHVQMIDELYQASWRPTPVDDVPQFGQGIPQAPPPHSSVANAPTVKPAPVKMGAYRPPGARGTAVSDAYKREDENRLPPPGTASPNGRYSRSPMRTGRRRIPGAAASPSPGPERRAEQQQATRSKRKGGKDAKKDGGTPSNGTSGTATPVGEDRGRQPPQMEIKLSGALSPLAASESVPPTPGDSLDPLQKKARNLTKKVTTLARELTCQNSQTDNTLPSRIAQGDRGAQGKG